MKTKVSLITLLLLFSLYCLGCNESDDLTPDMPQANKSLESRAAEVVAVPQFKVPANSDIDAIKARQYADASVALLLLGQQWSLRIEKATDQDKIQILQAYDKARDQVCAKVGLAGIVEYNWINTVAMKNENNQETFAKAGIKISQ